ncbi:MAG TPA: histidine phosphatase family protein, partial [Chitinolyticbacter sp.]|nr:histidine phosphatase family protein [Chitinolyticbacter sp.]
MSRTLYLLRHGQTEYNRDRRLQGQCDSPLTELGIAQAR